MRCAILISFLRFLRLSRGERGCSAQLPNAAPAIAPLPFRNQLEDFVDRFVFLVRPKLDAGDQQLIDGWQKPGIDSSWISNLLDRAQHTETPQKMRPEIGGILARPCRCEMSFLLNGLDFGQALKIENLANWSTRCERVSLPENPYG
jgi:hypothetical protein